MPHPSLGLPPRSMSDGAPEAAARLRAEPARLARLALEATLRLAPEFRTRYDELKLRLFLRDYEQHIEQLARALETGDDTLVAHYGEWLVPIFRRRDVPMRDFGRLLLGLQEAAGTVLSPADAALVSALMDRWLVRLKFHQRLPGDHRGNPIVRFFWKGAGLGDDGVV